MRSRRTLSKISGISETLLYELEHGRGLAFHERSDQTRSAIAAALKVVPIDLDEFSRRGEREPRDVNFDMPLRMPPVPSDPPKMPVPKTAEIAKQQLQELAAIVANQRAMEEVKTLSTETIDALIEALASHRGKRPRQAAKHRQRP